MRRRRWRRGCTWFLRVSPRAVPVHVLCMHMCYIYTCIFVYIYIYETEVVEAGSRVISESISTRSSSIHTCIYYACQKQLQISTYTKIYSNNSYIHRYVHIYMYIYVYRYINIYKCNYACQEQLQIFIYTKIYSYKCVYTHLYTLHVSIHTLTFIHVNTHVKSSCKYLYIQNIFIYIHIYIHLYIYICIYI